MNKDSNIEKARVWSEWVSKLSVKSMRHHMMLPVHGRVCGAQCLALLFRIYDALPRLILM